MCLREAMREAWSNAPCYIYAPGKGFIPGTYEWVEIPHAPARGWGFYRFAEPNKVLYIICYERNYVTVLHYIRNRCIRKVEIPMSELPEQLQLQLWVPWHSLGNWNYMLYHWEEYLREWRREKKGNFFTYLFNKFPSKFCYSYYRYVDTQERSTATSYTFAPLVVDSGIGFKIYQGRWVDYNPQQHGEAVAIAYIRGVLHRFSQGRLELYYSGSPCHRLYGLIVRRTQQPQQQLKTTIIQPNADYLVVIKTKRDIQDIQQIEFTFDKFTFFVGGNLQMKTIDSIANIEDELKKTLEGKILYVITKI